MGCANSVLSQRDGASIEIEKRMFLINGLLGEGGFGKVMTGMLGSNGVWYAVKEINKHNLMKHKTGLSMIYGELNALKRLENPFIIYLHFAFQDKVNCYLVFDLKTGGDLRYYLRRKIAFDERDVVFYVACLSSALDYIHSKNIIHRDIKPENIILDERGYPHLTDFGVAHVQQEEELPLVSCLASGTKQYLAPEVFTKNHIHGPESDFWSLGVVAYELLFNKRPFDKHCPIQFISYLEKSLSMKRLKANEHKKPLTRSSSPSILALSKEFARSSNISDDSKNCSIENQHLSKSFDTDRSDKCSSGKLPILGTLQEDKISTAQYSSSIDFTPGTGTSASSNTGSPVIKQRQKGIASCSGGSRAKFDSVVMSDGESLDHELQFSCSQEEQSDSNQTNFKALASLSGLTGSTKTRNQLISKSFTGTSPNHTQAFQPKIAAPKDIAQYSTPKRHSSKSMDIQQQTTPKRSQADMPPRPKRDSSSQIRRDILPNIFDSKDGTSRETSEESCQQQNKDMNSPLPSPRDGMTQLGADGDLVTFPRCGDHWYVDSGRLPSHLRLNIPLATVWRGDITASCRDFLVSIFDVRPSYRLGARNIDLLRTHPWLVENGLDDWSQLNKKNYMANFKPGKRFLHDTLQEYNSNYMGRIIEEDEGLNSGESSANSENHVVGEDDESAGHNDYRQHFINFKYTAPLYDESNGMQSSNNDEKYIETPSSKDTSFPVLPQINMKYAV